MGWALFTGKSTGPGEKSAPAVCEGGRKAGCSRQLTTSSGRTRGTVVILAGIAGEEQVVNIPGLEECKDHRHLLVVRDPAAGDPIESDERATFGQLLDDLRFRIVKTARMTDRDTLWVDAHRSEDVKLSQGGLSRHVRPGAVGIVREDRQVCLEMGLDDPAEHFAFVRREISAVG